jgi:uroporphyrinogen-III decarboxylase
MTSKDRFLAAVRHQKPDRAPFNFWMDRPVMAAYEKKVGHRHWRVTHFGADVIETFPAIACLPAPPLTDGPYALATEPTFEWQHAAALPMPDPQQADIYALIAADVREFPTHAVILDTITPWGHIAGARTYEKIYMDMYDYPGEFHALSRRITDTLKVVVERACTMGITALYLMEDLADRNGLSIAPAMIEEFCLAYANELADIARAHGVPVMWHCDGNVHDLLPLLRNIGVQVINPLQPHLNAAAAFKREFGRDFAVYGGLDNCYTIPNESAAAVRAHVLDVFATLGKPDGALIFSTHDIPVGTPEENLETMVRTIKHECVY